MRIIVLTLLVACVSASLLGEKKCTWGPTFWCSHVSHARQCHAMAHCLDTVWKNQIIKPESTKTCTYCQLIVNELKDVLHDKKTDDEIASLLTNICKVLTNTDWRQQCKDIVTDYVPEMIQMLENSISTDMICASIGFCSGLNDKGNPLKSLLENQRSQDLISVDTQNDTCQDCTKFFKDVQDSITSNETVEELEQLINQTLCSQLGSLASTCNDLVQQYMPVLLQALADQVDPTIVCKIFGFCSTGLGPHDTIEMKNIFLKKKTNGVLVYSSSDKCAICQEFISQIDQVLKDKTIQDKVKYELETVFCPKLGTFADQCKQIVEEYAPMLFELLVNELDPKTVCETLGLCTVPSEPRVISATRLEPAKLVGAGSVKEPAGLVGVGFVKDDAVCTLCKIVMQEVDTFIKANGTIEKIEELIDKICVKLPSEDLTQQCEAFVQEYGQLVITLLAQQLDPNVICVTIRLCKYNLTAEKVTNIKDMKCDVCVQIVTNLENFIQNVSTDDILKELRMFCSYLPANYSAECVKYINEYGPLIIDMLKSKQDPTYICTLAQMCPSRTLYTTLPTSKPPVKVPSFKCKVCDTAIWFLKEMVGDNATEESIKQALKSLCNDLPSEMVDTCDNLVEQYGDQIIQLLLQQLDPHTICLKLGLCQENKTRLSVSISKGPANVAATSTECELCKLVIQTVYNELGDNKTEEHIKEVLVKACSELPDAYQSTCKEYVDEYFQVIVNLILLNVTPEEICQKLSFCTSNQAMPLLKLVHVKLMKDNGPANVAASSTECDLCKLVFQNLYKEIGDNKTEEHIKEVLVKACSELPDAYQSSCKEYVDEYFQVIVNLILLNVTPEEICQKLSFCTSNQAMPLLKLVHVKLMKDNGPANVAATSTECDLCKLVFQNLYKEIGDNKTEEHIKKVLVKACSELPDAYQSSCKEYVDEYFQVIVNLILLNVTPEEICQKLSFCTSNQAMPLLKLVHVKLMKDNGPANVAATSTECDLCKLVFQNLYKEIGDNKTEEHIKKVLVKACSELPDAYQSSCKEYVDEYFQVIVNLILLNVTPEEICQKLSFCTSNQAMPLLKLVHVKLMKDNGPANFSATSTECELCKLVIQTVYNELGDNKTEEHIKEVLVKACSELPDAYQSSCKEYVDEYFQVIVNLILLNVTPEEICQKLSFCTSNQAMPLLKLVHVKLMKDNAMSAQCTVCKLIGNELKVFLQENRTVEQVETFLEVICNSFPATLTAQCQDIVKTYVPALIDLVRENMDVDQSCMKVGLCTSKTEIKAPIISAPQMAPNNENKDDTLFFKPKKSKELLGAKECTYGPAFWCTSRANAVKCHAVAYCEKHGWN